PGKEVFKLYDTYGFPKELTEEYVSDYGFTIDEAAFEKEMEKQRTRAREARTQVSSMDVQSNLLNDLSERSTFIGYDNLEVKTKIIKLIHQDQFVDFVSEGEEVIVILDETPFYAEGGGQIADKGCLILDGGQIEINNVKTAPRGQHLHFGKVTKGKLQVDSKVFAKIDVESRAEIVKNHTATHLLHQALKDVLGDHVNQAGSLVATKRLRFDFSHFNSVSTDEIKRIEKIVNEKIWDSISLKIEYMDKEAAESMGAMALFGEKYDEVVRVVQIDDYSIELCGGCHVKNTSEIGIFKILSESGIGAGTRRIEAVTGKFAYQFMNDKVNKLHDIAQIIKSNEEQVLPRVEDLLEQMKQLEKQNKSLEDKLSNIEAQSIVDQVREVEGISVLTEQVNVSNMGQLRSMMDEMRQEIASGIILLVAENDGKVQ